jgi:hypothetical protein
MSCHQRVRDVLSRHTPPAVCASATRCVRPPVAHHLRSDPNLDAHEFTQVHGVAHRSLDTSRGAKNRGNRGYTATTSPPRPPTTSTTTPSAAPTPSSRATCDVQSSGHRQCGSTCRRRRTCPNLPEGLEPARTDRCRAPTAGTCRAGSWYAQRRRVPTGRTLISGPSTSTADRFVCCRVRSTVRLAGRRGCCVQLDPGVRRAWCELPDDCGRRRRYRVDLRSGREGRRQRPIDRPCVT